MSGPVGADITPVGRDVALVEREAGLARGERGGWARGATCTCLVLPPAQRWSGRLRGRIHYPLCASRARDRGQDWGARVRARATIDRSSIMMKVVAHEAEAVRRTLEGRGIVSYQADEMALWESGTDGLPVFGDPQVPCVQCGRITVRFEDGARLCVDTNLFGYEWGLMVTEHSPEADLIEIERDRYSIYREAALERFPVGRVVRVGVSVNPDGHVRAISMEFERGAVTMVAGEFDEQFDGSIRLLLDDESVLFFPDGDGLEWAEGQVARGHIHPLRQSG